MINNNYIIETHVTVDHNYINQISFWANEIQSCVCWEEERKSVTTTAYNRKDALNYLHINIMFIFN